MSKTIQLSGFPYLVPADSIKLYVENITGRGTVDALEVKQCKNGSRAYAIVQFTSIVFTDSIVNMRLSYSSSYLKAYKRENDIIQKPRVHQECLEEITMHFGCQISKEKFSVLWEAMDVKITYGIGIKRMYFLLSHRSADYKLQLSYENIWQVQLYGPRGYTKKFVLIQLYGAPRIFKKLEISPHTYYKETPDDQWIRTTDFTLFSYIGQSSGLCLEFPNRVSIPNFRQHFAYYKEYETQLILENGKSFCPNSDLVPILGPPQGRKLPYKILFKICTLVQNGCLPGPKLDTAFYNMVDPKRINIDCIERALEKLYHLKECCYEPVRWLTEQYKMFLTTKQYSKSPYITLDAGLVYIRRVQVTPCKVYFSGPEVNMSNRVLRHFAEYIDNFLRVSFVDEEWDKMRSMDLYSRMTSTNEGKTTIYDRVLSTLRNGLVIGDKKFEFLAFSSSQLRDNSVWMFAPRDGLNAARIRAWMGEFHEIKNVAKYAARLGQSFGSSTETLSVHRHEVDMIPDVEVVKGGTKYIFSDGIGKISVDFAMRIAIKCGLKSFTPSAFQIRYAGYKGVVAIDPTTSAKLSLRESMFKYASENKKLDVLAWSKYQPCFLNRQLITLLSTLGVRDFVFEKKQREAIDQLNTLLTDPSKAQEALELMCPGENTNILKEMLLCGYKPDVEPYLRMMLQTFRASKLLDLRIKTRIFVPKGRSMMGCLDETRTLEYGQVFVQFSSAGHRASSSDSFSMVNGSLLDRKSDIVRGKVVVAKNPCLHPGDVRVLEAVNVPALHHMVDCVVFPQKGYRPHTNECSGSDLDGDIYFVCWDSELIPPRQAEPMDYTPAPSMTLDHDVTIEEVEEYFTNYIVNDSLGIIANAHTAFADQELSKAMSDPCIELAKLFSIAVDFPKTGVPAEIPPNLRVKLYPDFMEKPDKPTYESERVIGKLFREVRNIIQNTSSVTSFTREVATRTYDSDMEVDGFEDYVDSAFHYKGEYDFKLGNLMEYYGINTEAEILSGGIMKMSKSFDRRRDAEAVGLAMRSLRKEARSWFNQKESDWGEDDLYAKASAWYHVTYHPTYWGCYKGDLNRVHFLSFPWCVYDKLMQIKKSKARQRQREVQISSLESYFSQGLSIH